MSKESQSSVDFSFPVDCADDDCADDNDAIILEAASVDNFTISESFISVLAAAGDDATSANNDNGCTDRSPVTAANNDDRCATGNEE